MIKEKRNAGFRLSEERKEAIKDNFNLVIRILQNINDWVPAAMLMEFMGATGHTNDILSDFQNYIDEDILKNANFRVKNYHRTIYITTSNKKISDLSQQKIQHMYFQLLLRGIEKAAVYPVEKHSKLMGNQQKYIHEYQDDRDHTYTIPIIPPKMYIIINARSRNKAITELLTIRKNFIVSFYPHKITKEDYKNINVGCNYASWMQPGGDGKFGYGGMTYFKQKIHFIFMFDSKMQRYIDRAFADRVNAALSFGTYAHAIGRSNGKYMDPKDPEANIFYYNSIPLSTILTKYTPVKKPAKARPYTPPYNS